MKLSKITYISVRVVIMFIVLCALSFIPEYTRDFLGDWKCDGSGSYNFNNGGCTYGDGFRHSATWHWGYRHWLFFVMGSALTGLQIASIIIDSDKYK